MVAISVLWVIEAWIRGWRHAWGRYWEFQKLLAHLQIERHRLWQHLMNVDTREQADYYLAEIDRVEELIRQLYRAYGREP